MNETTHSLTDLEAIYTDAEQVDHEIFAEMRSNLLLVAGEHYTKKQSLFYQRVRDSKGLTEQQKLRLTKNHTQKICKLYVNNILSMAPGVGFCPRNENELPDQKSAELHHAIWQFSKSKYALDEHFEHDADDLIQVGEVACKIIYDPNAGEITGWEAQVDQDGNPVLGEDMAYQPDPGKPVFSGAFVFERVHGFNLLRCPTALTLKDSPYLIIRKMASVHDLRAQFPELSSKINESANETMVVFDASRNAWRNSNEEVMLKEYYFRPCVDYPQGYYYIAIKTVILDHGPLPEGIFPIVTETCERIQTTPRGRSIVKTMRPYQAEINRAASKIAEHQVTLGDDKILIQSGTKISAGVALPGVRSINYTGITPEILQGRDGSQYLAYMQAQIEEMYDVMMVREDAVTTDGQLDPYALLYKSATQRKRFSRYTKKFERYQINFASTFMKLAKLYMSDEEIVDAIGKPEAVNIEEFRNSTDQLCQIKLEAQNEDVETKMGKQLALNHLIQFTGNKLSSEDIGKLVRAMPYLDQQDEMEDLTLDYDSAMNDILALDRGEIPPMVESDNHAYMIKKLVNRMRKADFRFLDPQIQQAYALRVQAHQQAEAARIEAQQRLEQGFIPTGGPLITCRGLTVPDPKQPDKVREMRLPYQAIDWLAQQLGAQGQSLDRLEEMGQAAAAQMADIVQPQYGANASDGMPRSAPN